MGKEGPNLLDDRSQRKNHPLVQQNVAKGGDRVRRLEGGGFNELGQGRVSDNIS